jgi:Family of unknown function (DUF5677)
LSKNKNNQLFYLFPFGFSFSATPSKKTQKGRKCHQQCSETLHLVTEAKNNNLYSCLILYRSLLEHFFKSFLIFEKMLSDKSDEVAESYKKHLMISEFLAEKAGVLHMEEMINGNEMKTDFITFINAKIPELEGFDKENQQEISKAIKLFSLKESVKYLHSKFKDKESLKNSSHILAQFLPEYSYASTFTHGGSYGSTLIQKFIKNSTVKDEIERILEISLTSICVSKESIIGTYEVNVNTKEYIKNLQEIRN